MATNKRGVKIDSVMSRILKSGKDEKGNTPEDKIGGYKEAPGGGTPLAKGEKAPNKEWVLENREMQPRNPDGTFGYNSQNGKDLKYGPSRGVTVPHFLRGVELNFLEKGSKYIVKEGSQYATYILAINLTKENLIQICKQYRSHQGGFLGAYQEIMEKKKGRHSKEENEAISNGEEGEVRNKQGEVSKFDVEKASQNTQEAINKKDEEATRKYNLVTEGKTKTAPTNEEPVPVGGSEESSKYEKYASNEKVVNSAKEYLNSIGLDVDEQDIKEAILDGDFTEEDLESWSK